MRAVVIDNFGAIPGIQDVPQPVPAPGEIKVKVSASSVNPFDTMVVSGVMSQMYEHRFPLVLGKDFAGTVTEVGSEVSGFAVGDRIFGVVSKTRLTEGGGFGEYLTTAADSGVAHVPAGLDLAVAGAVGLAGAAAVAAVDALGPLSGKTVLVSGATGGVGAYAVQLAKSRGANVIATAASDSAARHVHELGADHTVNHRDDLATQVKALVPEGVDSVVHLAGDGPTLASTLAEGGHIVSAAHLQLEDAKVTTVMATTDRDALRQLAADVAAGRVRVPIARTYPLDQVAEAFTAFIAGGVLGKLAISVA
ncbi:NADP-dependent oxidoreductase [Kibdelosporangium aridum]|uniref:NADP-dependent oxidoreductase n=1 Tax=Kibdelosporangium aridum TaxID=2030 RepID=UPI000526D1D1